MKDAAIAAWGERFFRGEHNWAAPAVQASSANVSFRDIEMAVGMDPLREIYLRGNEAIHSGALGIIANSTLHSKTGKRHLVETRPIVDPYTTTLVAHATVQILGTATLIIASELFWQFGEWDDAFAMSEFYVVAERLRTALADANSRYS